MEEETKIDYLFESETIGVWRDEDSIFVDIYPNGFTFQESFESWRDMSADIVKLAKVIVSKDLKVLEGGKKSEDG